jgi:hypothetical protein
VADSEGENPDFGELEPLGELQPLGEDGGDSSLAGLDAEEFIPPDFESLLTSETVEPKVAEPSALPAAAPAVEVAAQEAAPETEKAEEPAKEEPAKEEPGETAAEKKAKPSSPLMAYLDWAIAGGVAALLLLLALVGLLNFSTVLYVISVGLVLYAIWKGRQTNDLYAVMLGFSLIAVLTAVYCLWLEVGRYHFDVKAKEAKQHASAPRLPETHSLA